MLAWLSANAVTVIVCSVIAAAVILAVISILTDKKKGRSSCGCSCSGCPMNGKCHVNNK